MRKKSELRGYQQRVVSHLYEHDEALAVLKMGAGKTISTLTALQELMGDGVIRHALVIAPKRVATIVWPTEIDAWAHTCQLEYDVLDGTPLRRKQLLDKLVHRDITIIGIDNVQWLVEQLEKWFPTDSPIYDCLIIDETSKLKDPTSKRAKALAKLAGRFKIRWGLTGTPIPNSLMDLFTPLKIITNGTLWGKSFYKWRQANFYPIDYNAYQWKVLDNREPQLLADAASVSIALGEGDMPELPDLNILVDEIRLSEPARLTYRQMENRLVAKLVDKDKDVIAMSRAVATGKLAQISNGFLYGEGGNTDVNVIHTGKAEWLEDTVRDLDGEPCIVVYEYVEDLAMIQRALGNVPYLGAGVSSATAAEHVRRWNAGELAIFALHPASGGHGLNLQAGGSRMIWLAPTWSAELWDQTIARIHRPGQKAHCMVHVCVATNTVDELKRMRVIEKLSGQLAFERYLASLAVPQSA
jgi:SNF2 family DNA or RNA helicase